jgi:hypothetical protein
MPLLNTLPVLPGAAQFLLGHKVVNHGLVLVVEMPLVSSILQLLEKLLMTFIYYQTNILVLSLMLKLFKVHLLKLVHSLLNLSK